ncbi:MAG: sugar phosphate isomerase/epimerase [Mogibacterium sp.]|nr:sugar phosphate isomerase/epimerase [Mogibacterium sp.]
MKTLTRDQILTSNYPYWRYSLSYALDSLERIGCRNIEFYGCYPHFHLDDVGYRDLKSLQKQLRNHGLHAAAFTPEQCLYPVNIASFDPVARKRSMEVFRKSILYGAELGAKTVVVLAGYATLDEDEAIAWRRSVASLQELSRLAERNGVTLVLETSPREYTTTHTSKDVVRMIREVGSPALSGMIDTATLGFSGETMAEAIRDLEGHLDHVHFADGVPNGHLIPEEGTLDLPEMLRALDGAGYDKAISLEILNDRYVRNPHEAMQKSYERLIEYISGKE